MKAMQIHCEVAVSMVSVGHSEADFDECHFIESCEAELFADSLEGAPVNSREENAHIFEAGAQLLLRVGAVAGEGG